MNWKDHLKAQGYTDAEIAQMETSFGADKMAKAFAAPMEAARKAEESAAAAKNEREEFENFYNNEVLPKVSSTYQDAINWRTRATAAEERLKAAKEYGFLADGATLPSAGAPTTVPGVNPVPGSPGAPALAAPANPSPAFDTRYVPAADFTKAVNDIPDMLGRLTKMSNEHFSLFGSPLLDVDTLITQARNEKKNVQQIWEAKYKVTERRAEIEKKRQDDHDKTVGEEYVRKYLSDHGQPFTAPGRPSVASQFTPSSSAEARHPWKGASDRKAERSKKLLQEFEKRGSARVQ
jgi:hypothetical protein